MVRRSRNVTEKRGVATIVLTPHFLATFYRGRKCSNMLDFTSFDLFSDCGGSLFLGCK
jgi:hypothetical protein